MRLLKNPTDPEDDKGKKKGRWTISQNDDGSYEKRRKNRRGDIIIKKITPIKKNKVKPEKEKKQYPKYTEEEERKAHSAADDLINKQKGFAPGTTPKQRLKLKKKKERQKRRVDRQVIRGKRKEESKNKRKKNRSFRENKPVKKLKGGNKIVIGGSQESSCSVKGKKSKHRKPCKVNV
jgi:hypothetical protein